MSLKCSAVTLVFVILVCAWTVPAYAGVTVYEKGDSRVDLGLIMQVQYKYEDPDEGSSTDELFFRRLRPSVYGVLNQDWQGIIQLDFGAGASGENYEVRVKWVNFQYMGLAEQSHLTFGSFKSFFSREFLTAATHLQIIERTFLGDKDYGNPDYTIGLGWDQMLSNRKIAYALSFGAQNHEQDVTEMSLSSPAYADSDSNEGYAAAARIDWYPMGEMPWKAKSHGDTVVYNRGDFHTKAWRLMLSAGAYGWWNDSDNNPYTDDGVSTSTTKADLDKSYGIELSGGIRGFGLSADAEYQFIRGELVDDDFTGGLYQDGSTDLHKFTLNAGYMLFANQVEVVGAWSYLDADNYDESWNRYIFGLNCFVVDDTVKFQGTYTIDKNADGIDGNGENTARLQATFAW